MRLIIYVCKANNLAAGLGLTRQVSKHKDVLKPEGDENEDEDEDEDGPGLDTAQKTALVVERATSFATTASQLKALEDQHIPTTDGFSKLAALRPRIAEAEARQLEQALKMSELRRRNGLVNQRYKQVMVLGAGRCWVDYNERLTKALRAVVREEYRRRADDEGSHEEEGSEEEDAEEDEL
jgi:hypothetical protein